MAFIPVKRIPATVEYEVSTISVTRGDAMYLTTAGQLTASSTVLGTTKPIHAVAAETVDFTSSDYPQTLVSSRKLLAWPVTNDVGFEALSSATPTLANLDISWGVIKTKVDSGVSPGAFKVDELVNRHGTASSATSKYVIGRFVSKAYGDFDDFE
jgi:hypothetical protein